MMRRGARFDANQARWQLMEERQHVLPLELTTDDDKRLQRRSPSRPLDSVCCEIRIVFVGAIQIFPIGRRALF
jgi:hypothetical protein